MPHYRKLYTKSVESLDINDMSSDFVRLMWVLLPLKCCREGRGMNLAPWLKANLFPLRDDVTYDMIDSAMQEFIALDMIQIYQVGKGQYFQINQWHKYQGNTSKEAPSVYPDPPDSNSGVSPELVRSESGQGKTNVEKNAYAYAYDSSSDSYSSHEENQAIKDVASKIATVAKEPYATGVNEDKYEAAAGFIMGIDAVDSIEGFAAWWKVNGRYKGKPALTSFLNEFDNYLNGITTSQPSANGQLSKQDKAQAILAIISRWGRRRYKDAVPELEQAGLLDLVPGDKWVQFCDAKPDQIQWMI